MAAPLQCLALLAALGAAGSACESRSAAETPDPSSIAVAAAPTPQASDGRVEPPPPPKPTVDDPPPETAPPSKPSVRAAPPPEPELPPEPEPVLEHRRARRPMMVYVEPRLGTPFRGKIQVGEVFELYETVPGEDCRGADWGRVAQAAYVCLRHTEPTDDDALALPHTLADGLAPFLYARLRPKDARGAPPPAPVYRSRVAMRRGDPPESELQPEHDYAFVGRRVYRDGAVLRAPNGRVVRERDVKRMKPSDFAGRDTLERPIPEGATMAWSITWPYAFVREQPSADAPERSRLPLHDEFLVQGEPRSVRGEDWYPVTSPVQGWVSEAEMRHWVDLPGPAELGPEQVWLDVDLDQQMLALRRGASIEFMTLVSSGNWKHGTPVGLYRIEGKWAWADMRSRAGDDETYSVAGVPWAMYFRGRYALHGTFWHNRFGRRTSHGCVNLSAHDARWVYERILPVAKPGFITTNEHAVEPGTLVRIRKGTEPPPDRRRPPVGATSPAP
ncbi:MAG: L,D-transpeptidase [Nannocystaceae bacterium]